MNISQVFSTPERLMILNNVIFETESINVNQIARKTSTSKALVSKYFHILEDNGILEKTENTYRVISSNSTRAVKILINLSKFDVDYFKNNSAIISMGLFGSAANGTNTKESDIDIWILHNNMTPDVLSKITKDLRVIGDVTPVYLTEEKINELKEKDPVFYHSLIFGSILIYGEHIDSI